MTDEQFKQLMDKLEEIKRAQQPNYVGYPIPTAPNPFLPPQPPQNWDGYPSWWREQSRD